MTLLPRRLSDQIYRFVDIEGLGQIFKSATFVGCECVLKIGVCGDDYDWQSRAHRAQFLKQGKTAHSRHTYVGDQHVRLSVRDGFQQVFGTLEAAARHARLLQRFFQHPANRLIVVHHPHIERPVGHQTAFT